MKDKVYLVWAIDPGDVANDLIGVFQTQELAEEKIRGLISFQKVAEHMRRFDVRDRVMGRSRCVYMADIDSGITERYAVEAWEVG